MRTSQFEAFRHAVIGNGRPCPRADLDSMTADIHHHLGTAALFDQIRVNKSGDRRGLLVVRCRPASPGISRRQVAAELERIWTQELRFEHQAAHVLQVNDDTVTLRFVTQWAPGGPYVTGSVIVTWTA